MATLIDMSNINRAQINLANVSQLTLFAKRFAKLLEQQMRLFSEDPWLIFLDGDLGTGKTTFVRAVLQSMGEQGKIKSPTYTIIETYTINAWHILHADFYRLADPEELYFLGIDNYLNEKTIFFIEWPQKGAKMLPKPDLLLHYKFLPQGRALELTSFSERSALLMESVHEVYM